MIIKANKIITFVAINVTSNSAVILLQLSKSPKSVHEERKTGNRILLWTIQNSESDLWKSFFFEHLYNRTSSQYISAGEPETKYPTSISTKYPSPLCPTLRAMKKERDFSTHLNSWKFTVPQKNEATFLLGSLLPSWVPKLPIHGQNGCNKRQNTAQRNVLSCTEHVPLDFIWTPLCWQCFEICIVGLADRLSPKVDRTFENRGVEDEMIIQFMSYSVLSACQDSVQLQIYKRLRSPAKHHKHSLPLFQIFICSRKAYFILA